MIEVKKRKSFLEACKDYFIGFVDFQSKTSRSGYWWAFLMIALIYIIPLFINTYLALAVYTILSFPTAALFVRRLLDVGFKTWQAMVLFYTRSISSTIVIYFLINLFLLFIKLPFMSFSSIISMAGTGFIVTFIILSVVIIAIEVLLILPTNFLHRKKQK